MRDFQNINFNSVQVEGLWDVFPIGEGGGSITKGLLRGTDLALTDMDPTTDWIADDKGAPALNFDGTNDNLLNAAYDPPPIPLTLTFWNFVATGDGGGSAFSFGPNADGNDRLQAHVPFSDNVLYWDHGTSSTGRISTSYAGFFDKWTLVGLEASGAVGTAFQGIYLDGVLITSAANSTVPLTTRSGIYLGSSLGTGLFRKGNTRDFRIYSGLKGAAFHKELYENRYDLWTVSRNKSYFVAAAANTLVLDKVQTGTIAFGAANTSRNVTITSVDTSKCFIIIDWQTDSTASVATTQHYRARLTSSTNIAFDRTAAVSGDDGLVRWWAVEFSAGITVRHFAGTSRNTNVAIGATVDLAKTFAIISDRPQTFDYDDSQIEGVDIVSTTNFQVKTDSTAGSGPNWAVQIVEFDAAADPIVEAVTITMSGGTTTNTGSISAVTVADSMLIGSGTWSETLGVASQMGFSAALDNTTTVSVTRVTGTGTLIAYMFVVDWGSSIDIRTGVDTLTTGEGTSETQTFSALGSTGDAIAFMRGGSGTFGAQSNHSGSPDDADYAEISLDSTTQITITRSGTSDDLGPYNWQVIDFAGFAVAGAATRRYSLSLSGVG